jgi:RNA polymerase sigma-70 factor (ECF subfamily)
VQLDPKIVAQAIAGDRLAFQQIVEKTWGLVYVFIHQRIRDPERARDLTQETMLKAYAMRASLRDANSLVTWLLTIATHKVIDAHRRASTRPEVGLEIQDLARTPVSSVEQDLETEEQLEQLNQALVELDDLYRTVLILRYWSGMTPAQIARLLGEPEGTIRNRLFRAHLLLRGLLETGTRGNSPKQQGERRRS